MSLFTLFAMIFMHGVMDFLLQGIMADMKQKSWWMNHPQYKPKYRFDYIPVLCLHGFMWAFGVTLPTLLYIYLQVGTISEDTYMMFCLTVSVNGLMHAWIDDIKANDLTLNLVGDQILHLVQIMIMISWMLNQYII